MISVVGVTHASDGQSTDTAKNSKFSKVGVTKGPYPVMLTMTTHVLTMMIVIAVTANDALWWWTYL